MQRSAFGEARSLSRSRGGFDSRTLRRGSSSGRTTGLGPVHGGSSPSPRTPVDSVESTCQTVFMATKDEIRAWLGEGKAKGATHTIIVCDTFDHEDYPVHVLPGEDVRKKTASPGEMQRVMEVYSHRLDHETQLAEHRAFHFD